ncbi:tubulin epsilon and delta complex protein 1-like isoform X2 [Babylonia areolata]|uniref:tubulin epsilon and delta complex protein 1-like isoform X2 n=1 Tax=Babylonia areolata TaxID=304850 RepID=UPI003FD00C3F
MMSSPCIRWVLLLLLLLLLLLSSQFICAVIISFMDLRSAPVSDDVLALYQSEGGEEVVQGVGWGEGGGVRSAVQRVQQMLVLNSRLKMRLRLLHASQQHWANLTHKIHNSTYGVSLNPEVQHLSTMQTYMLRHPQHSVKVLWLLEKDSGRLENLLTWEEKNAVFWEWMGSVLELKLQQMYSQSTEGEEDRGAPDTRTIFLDLPPNLGLQIASSRRQLMEKILHYESVLNRLEDLWESKRHTVSEWDLDHLLQDINAQICRLQASLGQPRPHTSPTPPTPPLTLVKKAPPGPQGSVVRVSNAMTAARQERELQSDTRSLQEEIDRLQEEADRLEGDLVSVRQQCVTQLTAMMTAALPNTVCILPPHLRSSLAS